MSSFERQNFSDQLSIDTPEQVDLRFNVAGLGSRFVAQLLDNLILTAFFLVELVLALVVSASRMVSGDGPVSRFLDHWGIAILIFLNFAVIWGYFALFEAYWNGRTPGKRAMKLRVIKDSGRQITFFESLARNLLRYVDYLPGMYLVGVITMLCNQRNKRLGDFAAGTIVVHEAVAEQPLLAQPATSLFPRSTASPADAWSQPASSYFAADAVAKLTSQDLVVIDAFFSRALDLPLDTRAAMASRILHQMAAKMDAPVPEGNPERALESIAYAMRSTGVAR